MTRINTLLLSAIFLTVFMFSCQPAEDKNAGVIQPELGYRSAKILEIDGFQFKDLNRNEQLDTYEDWRLSDEERSKDLLSKMSLEQKAGFMLISSTRLANEPRIGQPPSGEPVTSDFGQEDMVMEVNLFTRKPLGYPLMFAAATNKDVTEYHKRHFILRANPPAKIIAKWANKLQELCERDALGIPALIASNPRNHITSNAAAGLSVGETPFSAWPGELGLAAMRDPELVREFADIARQEWKAVGLRKGYMYMADLATEPRWQRVEGTFGEDAELAASTMREVVIGFQGEKLDENSVALTTKHFPGGGATEGGQDPHFEWGKREVFEGGMFENNLIPFKAAIEAGTSSIMPYYSYPVHTEYEEVAYAYNKRILQEVLRGELGFEGIINSDTGPIEMMPWGVEDLTIIERYRKALDAGINLFSGTADPTKLMETLSAHPELAKHVDESVYLLLLEKFRMGLFENPYVDVEEADKTVGKKEFQDKADLATRKSIVLLRNEENTLPLKSGIKVYFETYLQQREVSPSHVFQPENNSWDIEFVASPEEADLIVLWLMPKGKSLFQSDGSPLHVNLADNGIDVKYVNKLCADKPCVLAINFTSPWAINEIYNEGTENIKGVLATFGSSAEAVMDILTGKFQPTAKMPFTTPVSDEAAQNQKSDVPGYMEGEDYALFKFDEGMSY